jgi:predicted DNA-binding transcriptional regulator AlpA
VGDPAQTDGTRGSAARTYATAPPVPIEPLLVGAETAGEICGRSKASWWRDSAAGRVPAPIKLSGRTLWRVAELREWVAAGCPTRAAWQAMQAAKRGRQS